MSDRIFLHKDRKGMKDLGGTASPCLIALIEWLDVSFCALSQRAFLPHAQGCTWTRYSMSCDISHMTALLDSE